MALGNRGISESACEAKKAREGTLNSLDFLEKDILVLEETFKAFCTILDPVLLPSNPSCGEEISRPYLASSGIRYRINNCTSRIHEIIATLQETTNRVDL